MNKQQYEQKAKAIFKKYNVLQTQAGYEYNSTILGQIKIATTYTPQIKSAFFAIILRDSAKRINFIENFWAMDRNCKYNKFSDDPNWMLDEVEQFLDCLKWLENQAKENN